MNARIRTSLLTGAAILGILLFCNALSAETYYVDIEHASASNTNPGTIDQPWLTIQHAAETIQAGDTVMIRAGLYSEQVWTTRSGTAGEGPLVFMAYPGETPVIDGSIVSSGRTGFIIAHSYITVSGLDLRNWETGIWMEQAGNIEINDCIIHDVEFGIGAADGTHDFILNRVVMHHFDLYGFDASPSGGADCYNGIFNDCVAHTGRDNQQNVDGFALGHGTQHDFVFNRCVVYSVFDGFDISARNTTLNSCVAYDCWNGGYKLWQDNVRLVNCVGYNSLSAIVELDWDNQPGTTWLTNCTFYNGELYTVWIENPGDILYMSNCILAGGDNIGLAFERLGTGNYHGDYNLFHNDNPERAIAVAYEDEFTLAQVQSGDWTAYSGQDTHSLVATDGTAIFVDASQYDFRLPGGSPAVDNGTSVGTPATDIAGNPRPVGAGYDIGAYEYQGTVGIDTEEAVHVAASVCDMLGACPNPFHTETVITYRLHEERCITVDVYSVDGRRVKRLYDGMQPQGLYFITWDGKDRFGTSMPNGTYFCRMRIGREYRAVRVSLIR